jgi:polygalacturonase
MGVACVAGPSAKPRQAAPYPAGAVAALDVRVFGARGDGVQDDTAALQAALDAGAGKMVYVPPGTYLVDADGYRDGGSGGIVPRSGTRLVLAPDATLRARTTGSSDYVVVRLERVSDVTIEGGTIQGDRHTHTGREGEWGFGIGIFGATDITLKDLTVRDAWGDGIFVEEALPDWSVMSRNITLRNVVSTGNRRQGLSVLGVEGLTVIDSVFERTEGTPPSAGVDVEPGGYGHTVKDVTFWNCTFRDNAGRGFVADATTGDDIANVRIVGGASTGNRWEGVVFHRATGGALVSGMVIAGNGASGVFLREAAQVTVEGNDVRGNSASADANYFGIHVQRSRAVTVRDNVVRREDGRERQHRYGVALEDSTDVLVTGNDVRESGRLGDISCDRPNRNAVRLNRLSHDARD